MSSPRPPDAVPAEVAIDAALVHRLLLDQRPDLAHLPLQPLAVGWDNALFRVGEALIARLPRRAVGEVNLRTELRWLAHLAPALPLPIPAPVWAGQPSADYPFPWSLTPWLAGTVAGRAEALDLEDTADALGRFFGTLHRLPVPPEAPTSPYRGVPVRERTPGVLDRLALLADELDAERLRAVWAEVVAVPDWSGPPVWCHGDPHPFNLLTAEGRLSAVLDWGDLHRGEPAPDLAAAWMLLPPRLHERFRAAYGPLDEDTWARGRGWGLFFGVMLLSAGKDGAGAAFARAGRKTLAHVLAALG